MAYFQNPAIGGIGEMTEYENAVSMGIDQVNTYHPLWTSGIVAGALDGWTFMAGVSGSYSSVANAGGGQITVTATAPHGMLAGQVVALTSSSVAGYAPPNPTLFIIQSVTPTTFNVIATFTATATGTFTRGSSLTAGKGAAGKYQIFWSASAHSAGPNKLYKFEPLKNVTNIDNAAAGSLLTTTDVQNLSSSSTIMIAEGDIITMLCANQTDATDITIEEMNCRIIRYTQ